ncbi:TlpA family protein disulfide reductase [Tenacibaculum retecalamus]|uniref:TlpA family protein disulfide reductase n=1 Tax=Tenacibaculum retecalamus TaxID=3018315 RepID=UPI0023D92963|nr:TlpA disulfide reductase family protein [Tenacibaculum retecalamus]WBX72442.1 TlpA disulfide reductase family protein [Tenacibaculum retecalamus]
MKKLLFGALAITIISCNNSKPVDYTLFTGTIKNANSESIAIINSSNETVREIKVSDSGVFSDTIFNTNGYYSFDDGKESSSIYLKNGYTINLNLDAKEFDESIVYSGNGSDVNNFLAQKYLIKERAGTTSALYSLEETAYLKKMNAQKETLEKSLEGLDADFIKEEKVSLNYDHISHLLSYEPAHRYFAKKKDFKISDSFPDVLKGFDFNNEEHYKSSAAYKGIVGSNFNTVARENSKKEKISFETAALKLVKENKSEIIRDNILRGLSRQVSARNPNSEELYNGIMELSSDEILKKQLTAQFNLVKKLAKGKTSPVFENYENNAGGTTSLADLKGKYVYIDVWATWCESCKAEIPSLKKIEKKYHDKNIEFVSLSIDVKKDHGIWKQMIIDKELGGIQLMSDNDWKSKFVTDYGIQGIPRFILIDPAGNIVSSDAPRPSDTKLVDLFNELKI